LVGTNADSLQDVNGQPLGQVIWSRASAEPQGSLTYNWKNPLTGQEESKLLYYQKLDEDVCGVAADNP
jgi:cytochrome c